METQLCLKIWKELSLWNKIKFLILNIFRTRCCKPLILQTQITWSNRIHSLKYLRSATFGSKDIVIRKSDLWQRLYSSKSWTTWLRCTPQAKNYPFVLMSSPIKIWGKSVQIEKQKLLLHILMHINFFINV